ncbi:hypothetical protein OIV83_005954 [Microbotryomycetes sp. JL201]|nr:hypothetical protein OIV83_005954 [Microbotryomycetes sp. JL201]
MARRELVARQRLGTSTTNAAAGVTTTSAAAAATTTLASTTSTAAASSSTTSVAAPPSSTRTTTTAQQPVTTSSTTTLSTTTTTTTTTSTEAETTTSSAAQTSAASSATTTTRPSAIVVTITSLRTNSDGSTRTMTSESSSMLVPSAGSNSSSSSHTGRTWGIVGGSVGGAVVLAAALFVLYRCTQRRFSDLDNHDGDIKWPELQPDGQEVISGLATINPQKTRRTGGAGVMDDDDDDEWDEKNSGSARYDRPHSSMAPYGDEYDPYRAQSQPQFYDPYIPQHEPVMYPPSPARSPFQPHPSDSPDFGHHSASGTVGAPMAASYAPVLPFPGETAPVEELAFHPGIPTRTMSPANSPYGAHQGDDTRPERHPSPVGMIDHHIHGSSRPGSIVVDYSNREVASYGQPQRQSFAGSPGALSNQWR